jgi:hypothetical protein
VTFPAGAATIESSTSNSSDIEGQARESVASEVKADNPTLDFSFVGRAFPLSESVRRTCAGGREGASECSELWSFLKSFSAEPRDVSWATAIESRIASFVEESRGGDAKVRKVECRRDRCVLEVEAPFQFIITEFDKDPILSGQLWEGIGDLGFERKSGQPEVVVTVSTLTRRR